MKKVFILLVSLFAMMSASTGLKAQEITITLEPGWNWISYPNAEVMDVASALGSFAPVEGDQIKSRYTTSRYTRGRWGGGVTHLMPGWGYMYYSARNETVEFSFAQPSSSSVATATPTDITATSAVVGGTVTVPEGTHVFLRGVCWGMMSSPDIDGDHTTEGMGIGSFSGTLEGLNPNTTYYVRAYAVSDHGLAYGEELSFTTETGGGDHAYVDLGLPSGTLWATCNVGADNPEDYGDYFAWGETEPKNDYSWSTYQYCMGSNNTLTKYCNDLSCGYNLFHDNLTILLPEDDAALANWGADWRMPTEEEWQELYNNTTHTWTTQNGVSGMLFTASNGNSFFLPAAGRRWNTEFDDDGICGYYWSSSLNLTNPNTAWFFDFNSNSCGMSSYRYRSNGHPVRPVRAGSQNASFIIDATANPAEGGEVSGAGTYQEGTECALTAIPNEGYTFTNWTENGEVVSTEVIYSFIVTSDRTMVANFTYNGGVVVTTSEPTDITHTSAVVGSTVTLDEGNHLYVRGVCWSTEQMPTVDDNHLSDGSGTGASTVTLTGLPPITTYYVRAYAVTDYGLAYGEEQSFTTLDNSCNGEAPEGAINGKFTINANGDQVYFSQGNLQYIGSATTPYWKFADNQWDYLGTTTGQNSSDQNVDRDLFGWGTSGWNNGNLYYQPYNTENNYDPYTGYGYGPIEGSNFSIDLTGEYANADWGVYNAILNGGNMPGLWRTLTAAEWRYVFLTRNTPSGVRYAKAVVNGVNGVIVLPDSWSTSVYVLNYTNLSQAPFTANEIGMDDWQIMETNGAVFFPTTSCRNGTSVFGDEGGYWSASDNGSAAYTGVYFVNNSFRAGSCGYYNEYGYYGWSVRLAQDIQ